MNNEWSKISFPIIKDLDPMPLMKEIMGVQPMKYDGPPTYNECIDKSNPRVGVILHDEDKHPEPNRPMLFGCCREMWGRVFTPKGWILEKEHPRLFKAACKKYGPKYNALIEKERRAWNKKHGIKKQTLLNMIYVFDSKKKE